MCAATYIGYACVCICVCMSLGEESTILSRCVYACVCILYQYVHVHPHMFTIVCRWHQYYCHLVAECTKNLSFSIVFIQIVCMVCLHGVISLNDIFLP